VMERTKRFKVSARRRERQITAQKIDDVELAFDKFRRRGWHVLALYNALKQFALLQNRDVRNGALVEQYGKAGDNDDEQGAKDGPGVLDANFDEHIQHERKAKENH
jgi:hypothetical protein